MAFVEFLLITALWITSIFLIILVLIQRGRGGGLAGALGGMGGQSAFGAKAGDTFTRVTVAVAGVWIIICVLLFFGHSHKVFDPTFTGGAANTGATGGDAEKTTPSDSSDQES